MASLKMCNDIVAGESSTECVNQKWIQNLGTETKVIAL